jgi:hypothetical protein
VSILTPDAEAFIVEYMNLNHSEITRTIVQAQGGMEDVGAVRLTSLGDTHAVFTVDECRQCRVPWPRTLRRREDVREFLLDLYESALDTIADATRFGIEV